MTKELATVYDFRIKDGKPVLTPVTFEFDTDHYVKPDNDFDLNPSDELQQESARLNNAFKQGYWR